MKKKLTFLELLLMGIGQIIGAGIMVLLGIALGMTGKGVAVSFLLASVIIIIPLLSIAALGSAVPSSGGMYTYVRDLIGKRAGFFYVALLVVGQLILAQYALGVSEYAKQLWSWVNPRLLAGLVMTFVFVINIVGLKTSVLVQRLIVIVLIISLFAFVIFGLPQVKDLGSFFQYKNIFPNGVVEFLAATVLVRYALIGAEFLSEFGGDVENPSVNIPLAMILSTVFVAILYFLIAIVAAGILPQNEVAFKTLGVVAKKILPHWVYLVFMIGGGIFALISSLNAVFAWATKGIKQAIKDGWLPKVLAAENETFGTPHWLLLIYYLFGMYPIVTGQEMRTVTLIGTNIGLVFSCFPVIAIMFLLKKNPEAYKRAKFKLPKWAMIVVPIVSVCIYIIGIASSWDYLKKQGAIIPVVVFCVIVLIYTFIRAPYVKGEDNAKTRL